MLLRQVIEIVDLVDRPDASGGAVAALLAGRGDANVTVERIAGERGATEFLKVVVPGTAGKQAGGDAPTLGIIGRLGGVGARPAAIGLVSDGDGAVAALAAALKLVEMREMGDRLAGDVIVATHICPSSPVIPHEPVPFMGAPVDMMTMNRLEVDPAMDAILAIDTTKGNRVINLNGFAISPTVKQGWILRVSEDLLGIMQTVSGSLPAVFPITMQDITPYGNGVYHLNSILQPCTATDAPVVGVAVTTEAAVAGCATGASHAGSIETQRDSPSRWPRRSPPGGAAFRRGRVRRLCALYGSMAPLQTLPALQETALS